MAIENPPVAADEAANRARLANVATYGAAGHNMPLDVPAPVDPRQGAIDAALGRGAQIGATPQVQNQVAGQLGQVYDTGYQGLSAIRGATGGVVGGMANAAGEYERQLALAAPIEEGRNKVAIQKILLDQQRAQRDTARQDRRDIQSDREFEFGVKKWNAEHPEGEDKPPLQSPLVVAPSIGMTSGDASKILASKPYIMARGFILDPDIIPPGTSYDEFKGVVEAFVNNTNTDPENPEPNIDAATARLLVATYGPQFMTAAERKSAAKPAAPGAPAPLPARSGTVTLQPTKASQVAQTKAVSQLEPYQMKVLMTLAAAQGMSVEQFLAANPELLLGGSTKPKPGAPKPTLKPAEKTLSEDQQRRKDLFGF